MLASTFADKIRRAAPLLPAPFAPLPRGPWPRALTLLMVWIGALGTLFFLVSVAGPIPGMVLATIVAAIHALACADLSSRGARAARLFARASLSLLVALGLYEAVAWGAVLAWTVSLPLKLLVAALTLAALATGRRSFAGPRVPVLLPMGIFSAACLIGWAREEALIQCDDVLRTRAQPGVRVLVPSHDDIAACAPGDSLGLGRYPRKVWESPDGSHVIFTTQSAIHHELRVKAPKERIKGIVCSAAIGEGAPPPECLLDHGKGHNLLEDPARDRLLVGLMSGLAGRTGGILAVTREPPLREIARIEQEHGGSMFYDPEADLLGSFNDEGRTVSRIRASDFSPHPSGPLLPANFMGPDSVRFDPTTHKGLACVASGPLRTLDGEASLAVAFGAEPFNPRPLAPSSRYPSSFLALSWGCDWDATHTNVFVAVSSLGQLVTIAYDTGEVLKKTFIGFGYRTLTFDPGRSLIYTASFLGGDVVAIEPASGRVRARWFAGRFVRDLRISRDTKALLVTSNLGIVRIDLAAAAAP